MAKYSEYDYMFSAPKIASMSMKMPDDGKIISMSALPAVQDVIDRLPEIGITPVYEEGVFDTEKTLCAFLGEAYSELESFLPTAAPVKLMRTRYDVHNIKTAVKCGILGIDPSPYFIDCGNVPAAECAAAAESHDFSAYGTTLANAARAASDSACASGNARSVDVVMDPSCFESMLEYCEEIGFSVPVDFLRMKIDFTNLLTFVRIGKIRSAETAEIFLKDSIAEGGRIPASFYRGCGDTKKAVAEIGRCYGDKIAETVTSSLGNGTETLSRNLDTLFLHTVREKCSGTLLGALPMLGYIVELEYLVKNLRIVISGVASGTGRDLIRERLRV